MRWSATFTALALVVCCLGEATTDPQLKEAKEVAPEAGNRVLRKPVRGARGVRRVRPGAARPGRDIGIDGRDDDYLVNEEHAFRGNSYRELDVKRDGFKDLARSRGFGDSRNRGFATDARDRDLAPDTRPRGFAPEAINRGLATETRDREYGFEARDRGFGPVARERGYNSDPRDKGFAPESRSKGYSPEPKERGYTSEPRNKEYAPDSRDRGFAPETRGYDRAPNRAQTDPRDSRKPYNYRDNEGRDSTTDRDVGPATRNFAAPSYRSDESRGRDADRYDPTRLKDYYRNSGDSKSSDSKRWLKILAEFLKSSSEGRELLRARANQLLVGADVDAGQLPLPLLLVPVPVQEQQCAAPSPDRVSPKPELEPPLDYLPPDNATDVTPITPGGRRGPLDDDDHRTLIDLFREDEPRAPLLPPLLLPESPLPVPAAPLPPISSAPPPARLRFDRSLLIRAELTAYYSDYTEPYTVWYDADTGSSRVDMHGGTAVLYRTVQPGGEVERTQLRIERYEDDAKKTCTRLTSNVVDADRSPPGLPDTEPFRFDGHQETADGRMERWTYTLAGQAGELGGARGEALVFRHELLVARVEPDFAIPYRYRVIVDSSVLGPEVDWYEHRYLEVREQRPDPSYMSIDVARECDSVKREHRVEHVDPLREFVMTHRDTRCDTDFEKFKETYEVNYEDVVEEAVRKTMLIRSTRFVESANRQGSSALLEVNELSVLLPVERQLLLGLVDDGAEDDEEAGETGEVGEAGEVGAAPFSFGKRGELKPEPFPFTPEEVARFAAELPAAFSWKRQGAVTHVRNQGYCKTCWAFAVVAAVEGALFLRTGQLVPLSDQQLADCTKGPHSCNRGNHVRNPYQRIKDSGVIALGDYPRYKFFTPKVEQCRKEDPHVTKISGFVQVTNSSDALKVSIVKNGPNVVEVDSECDGFVFFKAGVLIDKRCNPDARNHAVTAIGFGRHKTYGNYFIVKNSWGLAGNRGYVHLHADTNTAGVHTAPSYPLLAEDDVPDRRRLGSLATQYPDERSLFKTGDKEEYRAFLKKQKEHLSRKKADRLRKKQRPRK